MIAWQAVNPKQPEGIILEHIIKKHNRLEENRPFWSYYNKLNSNIFRENPEECYASV